MNSEMFSEAVRPGSRPMAAVQIGSHDTVVAHAVLDFYGRKLQVITCRPALPAGWSRNENRLNDVQNCFPFNCSPCFAVRIT